MGAIRFTIDPDLVRLFTRELKLDAFVETGTYKGDSTAAVLLDFAEIHTVELSPELAEAAEARFGSEAGVAVHAGRSEHVLGEIAPKLDDRSVLYWLDAHWSDEPGAAGADSQCPVLDELDAIGTLGTDDVVMIDDARLFLAPPPAPADMEQWPSLGELLSSLKRLGEKRELLVIDDVFVLFPERVSAMVRTHAREHSADLLVELDPARAAAQHAEEMRQEMHGTRHGVEQTRQEIQGARQEAVEMRMEIEDRIGELQSKLAGLGGRLEATERGQGSVDEGLGAARSELAEAREALGAVREQTEISRSEIRALGERLEAVAERADAEASKRIAALGREIESLKTGAARDRELAAAALEESSSERERAETDGQELRDQLELIQDRIALLAEPGFARQRRRAKWKRRLSTPFALFRRPATWLAHRLRAQREHWSIRFGRLRMEPKLGSLKHHEPVPMSVPSRYETLTAPADAPSISIVTPSYNQGEFIGDTVRSVVGQGYPGLEYVVQDGNSDDGTRDVLEDLSNEISHWEMRDDEGQAHAVNLGLAQTSGEVMAYLNSDDLLLPGALAYVGRYFKRHPEVDVIYGHRVLIDDASMEIGRWVLPRHDDSILSWADFVPQETLFWRRSAWEAIGGGVDESFQFALDWDLLLRFRDGGASIVRVPRFIGAFRVHIAQKTSLESERMGAQEMARIRERTPAAGATSNEIGRQIRWYLRRHMVIHKLYRAGILRY